MSTLIRFFLRSLLTYEILLSFAQFYPLYRTIYLFGAYVVSFDFQYICFVVLDTIADTKQQNNKLPFIDTISISDFLRWKQRR